MRRLAKASTQPDHLGRMSPSVLAPPPPAASVAATAVASPEDAPRLVGTCGDGWGIRAAQFGAPDRVHGNVIYWLIVPGPPIACYANMILPTPGFEEVGWFHRHPNTDSIHIITSGRVLADIGGESVVMSAGDVSYIAAGVPHHLRTLPNEGFSQIVVQTPNTGYSPGEWQVAPEAGTTRSFGSLADFMLQFGPLDAELPSRLKRMVAGAATLRSPRWRAWVDGE